MKEKYKESSWWNKTYFKVEMLGHDNTKVLLWKNIQRMPVNETAINPDWYRSVFTVISNIKSSIFGEMILQNDEHSW